MRIKRKRIFLVLLAAFVLWAALPPRAVDLFGYLPNGALAVGYHPRLRATWKSQLKNPAVASLLAGYGKEPREIAAEGGVFWTFLLAVGEDVASAIIEEQDVHDGRLVLAAASPAGRRNTLLSFFWCIRWVPGLGRIKSDAQGRKFIDLTDYDEEKPIPIFLSVAFGKGVLRVKLSDRPERMDDMAGNSASAASYALRLRRAASPQIRHKIALMSSEIAGSDFPIILDGMRDVDIDIAQDASSSSIAVDIPIMPDDSDWVKTFANQRLHGANAASAALAGGHAFLFTLFPARQAAQFAADFFGCKEAAAGSQAGEDAAAYLTTAPYGGKFLLFDIPALTVSLPGLEIGQEQLRAVLKPLPKQLRTQFAIAGGNTVCSSAASLREQRHAAPPPPFSWRDGYVKIAGGAPLCAFLHADCDKLFRELSQAANAFALAASFAKDSLDPEAATLARETSRFLPHFPTGLFFDAGAQPLDDGRGMRIAALLARP